MSVRVRQGISCRLNTMKTGKSTNHLEANGIAPEDSAAGQTRASGIVEGGATVSAPPGCARHSILLLAQ